MFSSLEMCNQMQREVFIVADAICRAFVLTISAVCAVSAAER